MGNRTRLIRQAADWVAKHRALGLILIGYLALSLLYSFASPIFEPPDEATHFRYVKYLLDHRALPAVIDDGQNREEVWGLHQPPLQFLAMAVLAAPFDLVAPDDLLERNPHVNLGFAQKPGNKNFFLHVETDRSAYRSMVFVVRLLRFFSTICGAVTLFFVYLIGLSLFSEQPRLALVAPAFMALQPEFLFINAEIANEPLNITLMTAGLWGCLRLVQQGPSQRLAIFLGGVAGLIALTKMTGLALVVLIMIAMLIAVLRGHSAVKLWQFGFIVAGLFLIIGSWWYIRNIFLYGDPWQKGMYRNFYGDVEQSITFDDWVGGIRSGEVSFWAAFGWFNIIVPEWIYTFYKILIRVGLLSLLIWWILWFAARWGRNANFLLPCSVSMRPGRAVTLLLLMASPLVSSLVMTRLIATEGGIQGRQLLPMLSALALLVVTGYRQLLPGRWFWVGALGIGLTMAALAIWMPPFVIAPAYARPPFLTENELPADMTPLKRVYGDQIELLGYRLKEEGVQPGKSTEITLYWRADRPVETNYTVFVHALGRNRDKVGEYNGYPGLGTLPTSNWPVGTIVEDRYIVPIDGGARTPSLLRLDVGLFDFERLDQPPLPVKDETGQEVSSQVAQQVLLIETNDASQAKACPQLPGGPIQFADTIVLKCANRDPVDRLTLHWQVKKPPPADYTVFIQLWQAGQLVTGFDGPPFGGDFPSSYWRYGLGAEGDAHILDLSGLSDGDYQLLIGLYDPQTGQRLPALTAAGQPLPNNTVDLGQITIETD